MNKEKVKKIFKIMLYLFLSLLLVIFIYFFIGFPKENKDISWGINFSQKHAQSLGIKDWKQAYIDILDEMEIRKLKIGTFWDYIEWKQGQYSFSELDFQIQEAKKETPKLY